MRNPETSRTVSDTQLIVQQRPYQTTESLQLLTQLSMNANTPVERTQHPVISFAELSARLQGDEGFEE